MVVNYIVERKGRVSLIPYPDKQDKCVNEVIFCQPQKRDKYAHKIIPA
jgi:hypothetical protein